MKTAAAQKLRKRNHYHDFSAQFGAKPAMAPVLSAGLRQKKGQKLIRRARTVAGQRPRYERHK